LLPSPDRGEDAIGVGGPVEGFGVGVGLVEESVDRGLEVDEGAEDAAFEPSPREFGEEALDGVEPGRGGRGEVEGPAGMSGKPGTHLGMLVGGIVVEDGVDEFARRNLPGLTIATLIASILGLI
jgi:hypothetical protein